MERRGRVWLLVTLCGTAAFALEPAWAGPAGAYFLSNTLAFLGLTGVAAVGALAIHSWRRREARWLLAMFVSLLVLNLISGRYLSFTSTAMPITFDRVVALADAQFGLQPSFALGRLFTRFQVLANLCFLTYNGLLFALLLLCSVRFRKDLKSSVELLLQFAAAAALGSLLYVLLPVCGPIYAFPAQFPFHEPALALSDLPGFLPAAPRNGVPSLHFAWALLFFLCSLREVAWVRAVFAFFLAGTFLATMGMGEHYLTDLVIAVPFGCAIAAIRLGSPRSAIAWKAGSVLLGATLLWMLLLRFDPVRLLSPPRMIALTFVTTVGALWGWRVYIAPKPGRGTRTLAVR